MGRIDDLVRELCPDGVSYVKLGEVLDYEQPSKYLVKSTQYDDSYSTPVLTAGKGFLLGYTNEEDGIYQASKEAPTIIFDDFVTSFHWVDFPHKVKSSAIKFLRPKKSSEVSFRFVYYAMNEIRFVAKEHTRHWISVYSQFQIPLPPLSIQQQIVEVLDLFTDMIDNLQAELGLREKQMTYYREKLLSFEGEEVEQVKFVDYSNVKYGFSFDSSKFSEDASLIPLIRIRDVVPGKASTYYTGDYSDEYIVKAGDILVGMDGNFNLGVWNDVDGLLNQRVCKLYSKDESKLLNGFIKHYMKPLFLKIEKSTAGGSVKHLSAKAINSIKIPLPPLSRQQQIVEVLDTFTDLIDNIKQEITLRQKQYEFYREKLLTFQPLKRAS